MKSGVIIILILFAAWMATTKDGTPANINFSPAEKIISKNGVITTLAVSNSGKLIAYSSNIRDGKGDIILYNLDTRTGEYLTYHPAIDSQPVFAPDEKHIYYFSKRDKIGGIFRITLEKPYMVTRISPDQYWCEFPDVSHDGKKLVYYSKRNETYHLYEMDLTTNTETRLTDDNFFHFGSRYGSDGKSILYYSNAEGVFSVFSLNRNTRERKKINKLPGFTFQPSRDFQNSFYFAVNNHYNGNYDIFLIPFSGEEIKVTKSFANDFYPFVDEKNRWVYFISQREGEYGIYRKKF